MEFTSVSICVWVLAGTALVWSASRGWCYFRVWLKLGERVSNQEHSTDRNKCDSDAAAAAAADSDIKEEEEEEEGEEEGEEGEEEEGEEEEEEVHSCSGSSERSLVAFKFCYGEPECKFIFAMTVSVAFLSCNAEREKDRYVMHSWYMVNWQQHKKKELKKERKKKKKEKKKGKLTGKRKRKKSTV